MRLMVWDDGRIVEAKEFRPTLPYILHRIHTLDYKAYNVAHHIQLMRDASVSLFGFASLCRAEDAERIIGQLLRLSRLSPNFSCSVAMRLNSLGELSFEVEEPSYYSGFSLRVKRPRGVLLTAPTPEFISQNTITLALDAMYDARVQSSGDVAVLVDRKGELISRPWQPIFVVFNNKVYTPTIYETVEYTTASEAIRKAGFTLTVRPIPADSLMRMDEIFTADTMGITSLSKIGNHNLFSVAAALIVSRK